MKKKEADTSSCGDKSDISGFTNPNVGHHAETSDDQSAKKSTLYPQTPVLDKSQSAEIDQNAFRTPTPTPRVLHSKANVYACQALREGGAQKEGDTFDDSNSYADVPPLSKRAQEKSVSDISFIDKTPPPKPRQLAQRKA